VTFSHPSERHQGVRISYLGWQTVHVAHRCDGERCQQNSDDSEQQRWLADVECYRYCGTRYLLALF